VEGRRLVTGSGRYAGDVELAGQAYLALRRSHLPHARIRNIDVARAWLVPGVRAVFTAPDLPVSARHVFDRYLPPELARLGRPVLAMDEVRYSGEALAAVVAETPHAARDAALAIELHLDPLPAAGTLEAALAPGAAVVHEAFPANIGVHGFEGFGDLERAFGAGAVIVRDQLRTGRVCGCAMEPRAATATPEGAGVRIWTSTQAVFLVRDRLARYLGLNPAQVVVLAEDVGGSFGPKGRTYPEEVLVAWCALKLGRPVKWVATRSEDGITSTHAHGSSFEFELAADPDGTLRGLRGGFLHEIGAYASIGALTPSAIVRHLLSAYRLPALRVGLQAVFTHATPTGTVRGGGGPQGNFAIERMMDRLADRLGIDPVELRRRNLVGPEAIPYEVRFSQAGVVVDSGDFPNLLERGMKLLGPVTAPARKGVLRGRGVAMAVEHTGTTFPAEPARIQIREDGIARVFLGSTPQGQSHQTMAAVIVAERMGWPFDRIAVRTGDTRWLANAGVTASSHSAVHVGNAVSLAASRTRDLLLDLAAGRLGVQPADLVLRLGMVEVQADPAQAWPATDFLPPEGLDVTSAWETRTGKTCPSSCHSVEVEVDPDTGAIEVTRYGIVYDAGNEIDRAVVQGQLHGGLVHGIGYALFEEAVFDSGGDLLNPNFQDYRIPSPTDVVFEPVLVSSPTPTPANPEGIKGVGEAGTIAAPAAVAAAVEAAIRQLAPAARIREIPIRPETVCREIARANRTRSEDAGTAKTI
jgi:aerobic carbon-monoxide dehydrogenase large subunit